jgi:hypothetical protein
METAPIDAFSSAIAMLEVLNKRRVSAVGAIFGNTLLA